MTKNLTSTLELVHGLRQLANDDTGDAKSVYECAADFIERLTKLNPLSEWHEDDGYVLWYKLPLSEPPYVGCPLDSDWPGYHTHWTELPRLY